MAPEQREKRMDIGPAADVYAFGVVMFEAATSTRPHKKQVPALRIQEASGVRWMYESRDITGPLRERFAR